MGRRVAVAVVGHGTRPRERMLVSPRLPAEALQVAIRMANELNPTFVWG
jgi:hypothetical protein